MTKGSSLLYVIALCCVFKTFCQNAELTGELKIYHKITFTWEGENLSEAPETFKDYRLNIAFTSPSGTVFTVPGYFAADGEASETSATAGNKWRCHFAPNEMGSWSYRASFRTYDNIAASLNPFLGAPVYSVDGDTGTFEVKESDKIGLDFRGKGKLEYVGESYLRWSNQDYFLKLGTSSPEVFLEYIDFDNTPVNERTGYAERNYFTHSTDWQNGNPIWQNQKGKGIIGAINYLSNQGLNAHSFVLDSSYGDSDTVFPWVTKDAHYTYDISKLDQWQIVFDHMMQKGLMAHFILSEAENQSVFELAEDAEGDVNFANARKIYYRELVARFGYLNAITWNLGEENGWDRPNFIYGRGLTANQQITFSNYLKELLYYNDNIVVQNGHAFDDSVFNNLTGVNSFTGASLQGPAETIERSHVGVIKWKAKSKAANKPWVVSFDRPFDQYNSEPAFFREKSLWSSILAGAGGFEYNITAAEREVQNYTDYEPFWQNMKLLGELFSKNKIPFQDMESKDELVSNGWCFGKDYDVYVVYIKKEGTVTIDVLGDYSVKWFNPRNGGALVEGSVTKVSSGSVSVGEPPNNPNLDWVVVLENIETVPVAVTGVSIDPPEATLQQGLTYQMTAEVMPLNAANTDHVFSSSNTDVATVTEDGLVTALTLGETIITVTTKEGGFTANATVTVIVGSSLCSASGTILLERFENIPGYDITNLTNSLNYPDSPTSTTEISSFEIPPYAGDYYGARVRGFICAPETGTYYFWVSGDEQTELKLSASNLASEAVTIAYQNQPSFEQEWDRYPTQKSIGIDLVIGETYYIEALVKENQYADHLAVGWRKPSDGNGNLPVEVIPGRVLAPDLENTAPNPKKVIAVGVEPNEITIQSGATSLLMATVFPVTAENKTVTWHSNDTSIATVDDTGLVTGVSAGNAIITVTTEDGGFIAITKVKVLPPIRVTSIHVDPMLATIYRGETTSLAVSILPEDAENTSMRWASSDDAIATVNTDGTVTAVAAGTVTITVISEDGGYSATSIITVLEPILVTSIHINPSDVTLQVNDTVVLSTYAEPTGANNPKVNWSSSDSAIATVDENGLVTAIAIGNVQITVTSEDGAHTTTANLTVVAPIPVTGIQISPGQISMNVTNTAILTAVVLPNNASYPQIIWSSSDSNIASVTENGLVTAISLGTITITARTLDGDYSSISTITVTERDLSVDGPLLVYPIPAKDILYVDMPREDKLVRIEIYDAVGRLVYAIEKEDFIINGTTVQLSLLPMVTGLYTIHMLTNDLQIDKVKFIVRK